jgi:hypothetical protein
MNLLYRSRVNIKLSLVPYVIRVRIGEKEIEIQGSKEDVLETFDKKLPSIIEKASDAFDIIEEAKSAEVSAPPKEVAMKEAPYPSISGVSGCSDGVIKLFSTEWGKKPRTIGEIKAALEANTLFYPVTTVSGVLVGLVRQGKLRRWKTAGGYVYVSTS